MTIIRFACADGIRAEHLRTGTISLATLLTIPAFASAWRAGKLTFETEHGADVWTVRA